MQWETTPLAKTHHKSPTPAPRDRDFKGQLREMNGALLISAVHLQELTEQAQQAEESLRQNHAQLRAQSNELLRFNRVAVGRELRMLELKQEINELLARQGEAPRYPFEAEQDLALSEVDLPEAVPLDRLVPLEAALGTDELQQRPSRPPNYAGENRALTALTQALADAPQAVLQTLADTILEVLRADSGGISLLLNDQSKLYWPAIAGAWRPHVGKVSPRDASPSGDVLDRNVPLLFTRLERRYRDYLEIKPPVEEWLVVPVYVHGKAVGTIWAIIHAGSPDAPRVARQFDAEDLRQLESLARFAAAACQAVEFQGVVEQRYAALNLMEDAVVMREALRESEVRYRRLFESSKEGIIILDADSGRIAHANPFIADMLDYPRDELLGKKLWQIGLLQHARASLAMVRELRETGYVRYDNLPLETHGGRQIEVEVVANVYQENRQSLIQCTIRDITARRQLENQAFRQASTLAELHRRKDEFLSMLSHELRNPLAAIGIAVYMLRQPDSAQHTQTEARGILERQVNQLTRLVDDLLEVSRLATGKIRLKKSHVDLREVVESAAATSRLHCNLKSQSIELALPSMPVWILGDPLRLEQVVVNLLNNAHKYTDNHGRISVELERQGHEALLRVRDNGIGIASDVLPRIFDLFTQADKSLDRSRGGLGIGLALVRSLIHSHGGTVDVHSTLGEGSVFLVKLPITSSVRSVLCPAD